MHSYQSYLIDLNLIGTIVKDGRVIIHVSHDNIDLMIHLERTWKT